MAKAGGSFLRDLLAKYLDIDVSSGHEKKLTHFSLGHHLIVPVRDPVSRFESAFYSILHKRDILSTQHQFFYNRYPDINVYVSALSEDPISTLNFAWRNPAVPMVGRFSTLYYWLHSISMVRQKAELISAVIRQEYIEKDLCDFFEELNIDLTPKDIETTPKYAKPVGRFPGLIQENKIFLRHFLSSEYEIVNYLLELSAKPPYV
jgi:hypothetical protein